MSSLEAVVVLLLAVNFVLLALVLLRVWGAKDLTPVLDKIEAVSVRLSEGFAGIQLGFTGVREETANANRLSREELTRRLDDISANLATSITLLGNAQGERLDGFAKQLSDARSASDSQAKASREELLESFRKLSTAMSARMVEQGTEQTRVRTH